MAVRWKRQPDSRATSVAISSIHLVAITDRHAPDARVWLHELGHIAYDHYRDNGAKTLARYLMTTYRSKGTSRLKAFKMGDEEHVYSHSGKLNEDNEVWASVCALYWSGYAFPDDPSIPTALEMIFAGKAKFAND